MIGITCDEPPPHGQALSTNSAWPIRAIVATSLLSGSRLPWFFGGVAMFSATRRAVAWPAGMSMPVTE